MERIKKILNALICCATAITLANYFVYFVHLIAFPEQPLAFIITICVLSAVLLPIIFRKRLKRILKKAYPVLKGLWGVGLLIYSVSFIVMVSLIFAGSNSEPSTDEIPDDTVIIIYGAKVGGTADDAHPGTFLKYRLDYAADIMKGVPDSVCIVCGGKGDNEPCAEATVMRDYLISKGIAADRIFVDDESKNTIENIDNAMKIIKDERFDGKSVACLSTDFHVPRIKYLCSKAGLDVDCYFFAPSPNVFGLWSSLVREYMSYGKLLLTGHL